MNDTFEVTDDPLKELKVLQEVTEKVHEKFCQWTGNELDAMIQTSQQGHHGAIQNKREEAHLIKQEIAAIQSSLAERDVSAAVCQQDIQQERKQLEESRQSIDNLLRQKEQLKHTVEESAKEHKKQSEVLEHRAQNTEAITKELSKSENFYCNRLGIQLKKVTGERLQFIFTNIDPADPKRSFYFSVRLVQRKYTVVDCEPVVPDLDSLVEKLNSTNNLKSFVVAIRQCFLKFI